MSSVSNYNLYNYISYTSSFSLFTSILNPYFFLTHIAIYIVYNTAIFICIHLMSECVAHVGLASCFCPPLSPYISTLNYSTRSSIITHLPYAHRSSNHFYVILPISLFIYSYYTYLNTHISS